MIVKDIMQTDVTTVGANDSLHIAEDLMTLGHLRHLPVIVGDHRLVGLVTERDLEPFVSAEVGGLIKGAELKTIPVRMVMRCGVATARPGERLSEALQLMIDNQIGCLPVVDGDKLAGLLTQADCLRAFAELLDSSERVVH